eukprot:9574852-Alexandrium_andersonii.AAC.1
MPSGLCAISPAIREAKANWGGLSTAISSIYATVGVLAAGVPVRDDALDDAAGERLDERERIR